MNKITRRNFVNGTLMASGASLLPLKILDSQAAMAALDSSYYPPALTGLRGSHPGSNDHAHALAWGGGSVGGSMTKLSETYDLVVVGGGISGLAAAYFFQQQHGAEKNILILDNHDDFGGHAKRNEHVINGNTYISYGGSQSIVEPKYADRVVLDMFEDIGIDLKRFNSAYDLDFYKRHGLGGVTYFNKEVFGQDKLVQHPYCNYPNYVEGLPGGRLSHEDAAAAAPLSEKGRAQLLRVLNGGLHTLNVQEADLQDYIDNHSYFDYLKNNLGVDDPGVLRMARHSGLDWGNYSAELMSIAEAKSCGAMGFAPKAVYDEENPYIYHYPDGNASIARALVKKLISGVAKGSNAEALVLAQFDYAELDRPGNPVRLRLNSTVVNVRHGGNPASASEALVSYVNGNQSFQVRARNVVMACYNMMIPHIVSDLPKEQAAALSLQTKSPFVYTSVGLKNWRAMKDSGIGVAMSPGNMHQAVLMDFPVSMGGYNFTDSADEPCVIQMISCPFGSFGAEPEAQFREARYRMLSLQFDDYEEEIRRHLSGMLAKDLFDFDRDVVSISVNRWAHGYTFAGPGDSVRLGRQPFGRVTVANSDSAPGADAKTAVMMAHRAVNELA
ncbi:MAG: NAD(P)/FAD-dependent oxidoreductase [Gammaproteobacteria bacterium]|nr:NAD(P)/FAD-dependent oxidoreductase [Gammaproteobacteria bacterium]